MPTSRCWQRGASQCSGLVRVAPYIASPRRNCSRSSAGAARPTPPLGSAKRTLGSARAAARSHAHHLPAVLLRGAEHGRLARRTRTIVTTSFVEEAAQTGIDIFRIFDAPQQRRCHASGDRRGAGGGDDRRRGRPLLPGDPANPGEDLYTLDYYLRLAEQIVDASCAHLAIKDMAGLLRPPAAATLVTALRKNFDLPVHVHRTPRAGSWPPTWPRVQAGADAIDGAGAPLSGSTVSRRCRRSSPPSTGLIAPPGSTSTACSRSSRTGRRCVRCTHRSTSGSTRRPAVSTNMRFPAGGSPTSTNRLRRSAADRFPADRGRLRGRGPHARAAGQGDPLVRRSSATWR